MDLTLDSLTQLQIDHGFGEMGQEIEKSSNQVLEQGDRNSGRGSDVRHLLG